MADHQVDFTINIGGNAYKGVATLDAAMGKLNVTLKWQDIVLNILIAKETLAGIEMGWKGKDKTDKAQASLGTNAQLQQAVSGSSADGKTYEFRNGILTDAVAGILAPPPMLTFERKKNIITTKVDGSDAVIVESFGLEPWTITIDGILVDLQNHQYPASELRQLREMFETNTTYEVWDCDILADLGVEQMYFEKVADLKVLEDYQDTVKYKLTAHSIKPVEFFI